MSQKLKNILKDKSNIGKTFRIYLIEKQKLGAIYKSCMITDEEMLKYFSYDGNEKYLTTTFRNMVNMKTQSGEYTFLIKNQLVDIDGFLLLSEISMREVPNNNFPSLSKYNNSQDELIKFYKSKSLNNFLIIKKIDSIFFEFKNENPKEHLLAIKELNKIINEIFKSKFS